MTLQVKALTPSTTAVTPSSQPVHVTAADLRDHVLPLRSIDPADEDFSDLMPLIDKIGTARVVVLGEATHSEGTADRAKARLVRFLHQKMGFEVLAWESGFVQCHGLDAAIRNEDIPLQQAKAFLMSGGWATSEGPHSVFEYARSSWKRQRPLLMAGFDTGRPHYASRYFRSYVQSLGQRSPMLSLTEEQWTRVDGLTQWCYGFLGSTPPPAAEMAEAQEILGQLQSKLANERMHLRSVLSQEELLCAEAFLRNALQEAELRLLPPAERNPLRDKAMAEHVQWTLEKRHPGRKVIIWAATAHFIRNSERITNPEHPDWYAQAWQAGNHLAPVLKEDLYTIAVTSWGGEVGEVFPPSAAYPTATRPLEPAPPGSVEAAAHELEIDYSFLDLRSLPEGHRLREPFVSVCLGRNANIAPWDEVIDALLFIDEAEPVRHLP